jgi:TolA-binding protein
MATGIEMMLKTLGIDKEKMEAVAGAMVNAVKHLQVIKNDQALIRQQQEEILKRLDNLESFTDARADGLKEAAQFLDDEADANFMPNQPAKNLLKGLAIAIRMKAAQHEPKTTTRLISGTAGIADAVYEMQPEVSNNGG